MEIQQLLAHVPTVAVRGPQAGDVCAVACDSRAVQPGGCFVAVRGRRADGHKFLAEALARGARLLVGEAPAPPDLPPDRTYAQVADSRRTLATLAATFYGHPSRRMGVVGITGTDGKTTTTALVSHLLAAGGLRTGHMSTVDFAIADEHLENDTRFTTLEAPEVQRVLRRMADAELECAVVETTSSGLALHRVAEVAYDIAVLTNLTSEHLEVHGTWEAYRDAKALLFAGVAPEERKPLPRALPKACVLNADDPSRAYLRARCRAPVLTYGIAEAADVRATEVELTAEGARFRIHLPDGQQAWVATSLMARFNVSNCLAALATGHLCGIPLARMVEALATFAGVPGRLERIHAGQPFSVIVDYAHTAASLHHVLRVLRPLTAGRLLVVFGSAGERDRAKRPAMGAVAADLADLSILTDEDPREEDAQTILAEIAEGARSAGAREGEHYICLQSRRAAIQEACQRARPGDTVLIAGKGHEQSIFIGSAKLPWDDRQVARDVLAALGYGRSRQSAARA